MKKHFVDFICLVSNVNTIKGHGGKVLSLPVDELDSNDRKAIVYSYKGSDTNTITYYFTDRLWHTYSM